MAATQGHDRAQLLCLTSQEAELLPCGIGKTPFHKRAGKHMAFVRACIKGNRHHYITLRSRATNTSATQGPDTQNI